MGESERATAMDPADRPAASGHRFGPDLACSECGVLWDSHQREPAPCMKEDTSDDVFLRRPAPDAGPIAPAIAAPERGFGDS